MVVNPSDCTDAKCCSWSGRSTVTHYGRRFVYAEVAQLLIQREAVKLCGCSVHVSKRLKPEQEKVEF
jgi:hypothetical protein